MPDTHIWYVLCNVFVIQVPGWCVAASPDQRALFSLPGGHGNGLWKQQGKVLLYFSTRWNCLACIHQQGVPIYILSVVLSGFQEPSLFAVAKLLETGLVNMDRIEILWRPLTGHLLEVTSIYSSNPQGVLKHCISFKLGERMKIQFINMK